MQPVAERGGSDQALLRLVRSLPPGEFDFHIALPGPSPLATEFAAAGATLHEIPMHRLSTSHGGRPSGRRTSPAGRWRWPGSPASPGGSTSTSCTRTPSTPGTAGPSARLVRRPARRPRARDRRAVGRRAARRARAVPAVRDPGHRGVVRGRRAARSRQRRRARRVPRSRRVRTRASRAVPAPGSACPTTTPVVGAVARLDPLKGLDVLLDAFGRVRAARPAPSS